MYHRRSRSHNPYRSPRTQPVTVSLIVLKKKSKCKACNLFIQPGEQAAKLRLRKHLRQPCATCGHKPVGSKKYHLACQPTDLAAAMNYVAPANASTPGWAPATAAPPPKVDTYQELSIVAMNDLEKVLIARIKDTGLTDDLRQQFAKYKKIKSLALGAKTDGEQLAAIRAGLLAAVKLAF